MALTPINSEDRLVQRTFADHPEHALGWENVYAWNDETFGPDGAVGRKDTTEAVRAFTAPDFTRSMVQHNQDSYRLIRDGVPVRTGMPRGICATPAPACWITSPRLKSEG